MSEWRLYVPLFGLTAIFEVPLLYLVFTGGITARQFAALNQLAAPVMLVGALLGLWWWWEDFQRKGGHGVTYKRKPGSRA